MRIEGKTGTFINRDTTVTFMFEGREYQAYEGDTIASALIANDELVLSRSFKYHRPRGVLTMSGHDANALVQIDNEPNVRADRQEIYPGLQVKAQNYYGSLKNDYAKVLNHFGRFLPVGFYYKAFFRPKGIWKYWDVLIRNFAGLGKVDVEAKRFATDKVYKFCDVAIIGAGPAGLAAAKEAADSGADVILIDENKMLGGALNYSRFGLNTDDAKQLRQSLVNEVEQNENITVYKNSICSGWFADNYLTVMCKDRMLKVRAATVIAATGMFEQPIVFRNNDLPGVMLSSAISRLINLYGVVPKGKGLIVLTCDDGYAAALDILDAGIEITAIIDVRTEVSTSEFLSEIQQKNIDIYHGYCIDEAIPGRGNLNVTAANIKRINDSSHDAKTINIECDFIGMSGGYSPAAQLICHSGGVLKYDDRYETFKVADLPNKEISFLAGSLNHYHKLDDVIDDGRFAASCCVDKLGLQKISEVKAPNIPSSRIANCASPISPHPKGKDFIDFDEDLQVVDIVNAVKDGYDDLDLVKRYSTIVMGPSQGRHSALNNIRLVSKCKKSPVNGATITTQRPPYYPEYIQSLAGKSFQPVKHTAMHRRHSMLNAKFIHAGPWLRPAYYQSNGNELVCIQNENLVVRNNVGLIDVSTLGKIEITGIDAAEFLGRMYTFAYKKQAVGKSRYVLMTDKTGSIIDDGVACRFNEFHFYVTTTSSGSDNVYRNMLYWNAQWNLDVCISNVTSAFASVNLAGPNSRIVLQKVVDDIDLSPESFEYMDVRSGHIQNIPVRILRVGFVGELGYEIHVPYSFGEALWDILMKSGESMNIKAVGVEAQRLLRLEKGHIIVGQDSDGLTNPHEVNMSWAIADKKPFFIGKRAIEIINSNAKNKCLVGFRLEENSKVPEECNLIVSENEIVGRITSVSYSPTLKSIIGLALVSSGFSEVGSQLNIKLSNGKQQIATICNTPFYDPNNERQNL